VLFFVCIWKKTKEKQKDKIEENYGKTDGKIVFVRNDCS
jgi:hypothetical protein